MFKGIRANYFTLSIMLGVIALMPSVSYAASDEEIASGAMSACRRLGGSYTVDREAVIEEGNSIKECAKIRCSVNTSGAGGVSANDVKASFPNVISESGGTISAWKRACKTHQRTSDNDFIVDVDGSGNGGRGRVDVDVDGSWNGGAGGGYYINGRLVSRSEWERQCLRRNGKVKKKCTRGRAVYDDYYYDTDVSGGGRGGSRGGGGAGGSYVIVRRGDGSTFRCTYTTTWDHCLGEAGSVIVSVHGDADHCVNCGGGGRGGRGGGGTLSGIAEIAGAILPPLAYLGSNWLWSDAYLGANQAWAGAAATGFEQCQLMQTNHMHSMYGNGTTSMQGYFANNELPHEYIAPPGCNGYHLGGFAGGMGFMGNGMGGFGHPWMGAGYSPGFMNGMYGPYGMYNPYGSVIGMGGMGMGMPGMGGMGGGINIGMGMGMPGMGMGGMGMGMPGMGMGGIGGGIGMGMGMPGMGMGGMGMGVPGFGGGMYYPGMGGMGGGMGMGMPGMGMPGIGGGIGMGIGSGFPGGGYYGPGGMYNPGMGGAMGAGLVPWGNGAGSYWNGSGGWGGGMGGGMGMGGQANFGNIQQSYALNQQAAMQGNYYQQAALQNTFNQAAGNMWSQGYGGGMYGMGNYGYAPYSPGNMGLGLSLGWGFGF
jgi:hypothetical protein